MAVTIDLKKKAASVLNTAKNQIVNQAQAQQAARTANPVSAAYDDNTNYMALMQDAANRGDYQGAARYEQQRNSKITGKGLDTSLYTDLYSRYLPENRYSYDPAKNAEYTAAKAQQDAIFDKIMNRGTFSYDAESDPLYQQYRDQYTTLGKQAMRDTMGQAAALTGGYGSTYAQQAGQQSYDAYLARLNDVLPELYGDAYDRWQDEGSALLNQYNIAAGAADTAYNRDYQNWANRLNLELADEDAVYNRRLMQEQTDYTRQQDAYAREQDSLTYLTNLISSTGYTPTDDELKAAGMTRGQANALKAAYEQALAAASFSSGGGSGRSGGSGRRGRSGGSGSGSYDLGSGSSDSSTYAATGAGKNTQKGTAAYNLTGGKKDTSYLEDYKTLASAEKYWAQLDSEANGGMSTENLLALVKGWQQKGLIDQQTAAEMIYSYKLNKQTAKKSSGGGKTSATGGANKATKTKGSY